MPVGANLRYAAASDPGRRRRNNEDRYYVNPERGIYAVIDGVGGHAAGERAAETAVDVVRQRLERPTGTAEERLREAITLANNEIYRLSRSRAEWNGMACVLTVALIEDEIVTVGHVGDSRLYLLRPGEIRKITHDHSPVGEREDRGEITESEAMRHSRRNEIYRDVGSTEKAPDDAGFIDIVTFPMPLDGALLLCSDGLSDLVKSDQIRAGVERYAADPDIAVRALIDAANHAGGKDNITVMLIAGPDYKPEAAQSFERTPPLATREPGGRWPWLACGLAAGVLLGTLIPAAWNRFASSSPRTIIVGTAGINAAMRQSHFGDTVVIPQGRYRERVDLHEGVTLRSQAPGAAILTSPDGGPSVVAHKIDAGELEGVWIQGDEKAPFSTGIQIEDASPSIVNVKITGAKTGIDIKGASAPLISSSQITNNPGAGIVIEPGAKPRIENNLIAANGNDKPGEAKPGIEVSDTARPVLKDNGIVDNAAEPIRIYGRSYQPADFEENFFGGLPAREAIRLVEPPAAWRPATFEDRGARPKSALHPTAGKELTKASR